MSVLPEVCCVYGSVRREIAVRHIKAIAAQTSKDMK